MFNSFCWVLNVLHLSYLAALLRLIVLALLFPVRKEGEYDAPCAVGCWHGWIEVPVFGVVAFRHWPDKSLTFRW